MKRTQTDTTIGSGRFPVSGRAKCVDAGMTLLERCRCGIWTRGFCETKPISLFLAQKRGCCGKTKPIGPGKPGQWLVVSGEWLEEEQENSNKMRATKVPRRQRNRRFRPRIVGEIARSGLLSQVSNKPNFVVFGLGTMISVVCEAKYVCRQTHIWVAASKRSEAQSWGWSNRQVPTKGNPAPKQAIPNSCGVEAATRTRIQTKPISAFLGWKQGFRWRTTQIWLAQGRDFVRCGVTLSLGKTL